MTAPVSDGRSSRLPSLTGLRWWAAMLVFLQHIALESTGYCLPGSTGRPVACTVAQKSFMHGFVGVACFFVLSGFVLAWVAGPGDTKGRFWRRRFAKIYPLFLLAVAVDILVRLAVGAPKQSFGVYVANVFLVQTWIPDVDVYTAVLPVIWSLSCELFFYLCFPFLYAWFRRLGDRTLAVLAAGLVFWALVPVAVAWLIRPSWASDPKVLPWLLYMFPPTRISEFALGMIAALLVKRGALARVKVGVALPVAVAAFAAGAWLMPKLHLWVPSLGAMMAPVFALLIVALANADIAGAWSPMRGRTMVKLGMISYAFYLFHVPVAQYLGAQFAWDTTADVLAYVVTALALTALYSWALHEWFEKPGQRLLGPSPRPRKASAVVTLPARDIVRQPEPALAEGGAPVS